MGIHSKQARLRAPVEIADTRRKQQVGSLAVKSVGPVTERPLVALPEPTSEKSDNVPLSKALIQSDLQEQLGLRVSAK